MTNTPFLRCSSPPPPPPRWLLLAGCCRCRCCCSSCLPPHRHTTTASASRNAVPAQGRALKRKCIPCTSKSLQPSQPSSIAQAAEPSAPPSSQEEPAPPAPCPAPAAAAAPPARRGLPRLPAWPHHLRQLPGCAAAVGSALNAASCLRSTAAPVAINSRCPRGDVAGYLSAKPCVGGSPVLDLWSHPDSTNRQHFTVARSSGAGVGIIGVSLSWDTHAVSLQSPG